MTSKLSGLVRLVAFALLAAYVGGLAGCAQTGATVVSRLDENTGVTVTRTSRPIVFYADDSARAAHARDFVYMGPVEINRMGEPRYYLWLGIWSTLSGDGPAVRRDGFETITIFADGEPVQLDVSAWSGDAIGVSGSVYVPPVASAADAYYEATIDQIRLIANSTSVRIVTTGPDRTSYELWDGQRPAFEGVREFLSASET